MCIQNKYLKKKKERNPIGENGKRYRQLSEEDVVTSACVKDAQLSRNQGTQSNDVFHAHHIIKI